MKKLITSLLVCFSVASFAQKGFQGKAVYMSKTTVDMSRFGNNMSEQRKKQMMDRMRNFLEKTYILTFDQSASIFKEDVKLDAPGGGGSRWGGSNGKAAIYKNTKDKKMIEATEFFGKNFLITEKMDQPKWELGTETKKIGNYTAYKATMTRVNNDFDWSSMRRGNTKEKDSTDNKKKEDVRLEAVTAWYTPEIPVSTGPDEFYGLPGLILELTAGRTTMLCTEIVINPDEKVEIDAPDRGDEVSRKEYNKIVKKKTEEMRERFNGRGRGRRF